LKIQLWKRKNYSQKKNNLYLRYRINQNKAKVESLKLWEWVIPKNEIEKEHNNNVRIACEEIIRRTKDDLDNGRITIKPDAINDSTFKNQFYLHSNIKNSKAVYKFIGKNYEDFDLVKTNRINQEFLLEIKKRIEKKIKDGTLKGSTASKYWNNFKTVLINLHNNKICSYPNVPGISYKKERKVRNTFSTSEINKLESTNIKKWKDLKIAFLFSCKTGAKSNIIQSLMWKHIYKNSDENYYYKIKINKKQFINTFSANSRKLLGKRKNDRELIFNLPEKRSSRSKSFKKWINNAGINESKIFNDAVNTFAYNTYNKTKNIYKISATLGHESIQKTKEIYEYMSELDYINIEMNIDDTNNQEKEIIIEKKLFKKGNLLSYRKDTL
jgi:hypothetical protein